MEEREKQIIELKIKYNEKKIMELEDTDNNSLIDTYRMNIKLYKQQLKNI